MFDPFKDYDQAGYLRNRYGEKDPEIVRELEHALFRAGLDDALGYLAKRRTLAYADFLEVHRILFAAFYPWARQDRAVTTPNIAVSKADTVFSHPLDARRAVEEGLRIGQDKAALRQRPGEVMGWFAYGHPFLDGNGRTMLIIHSELCHRCRLLHRVAPHPESGLPRRPERRDRFSRQRHPRRLPVALRWHCLGAASVGRRDR